MRGGTIRSELPKADVGVGPCSRQREERVPRPRDGTELVLTEEQAGVDGWALEGATGGRSVVV